MIDDKIRVGDVVSLKSGGPRMTVDHIDGHGWLDLIWADGDSHLQRFTAVSPGAVVVVREQAMGFGKP